MLTAALVAAAVLAQGDLLGPLAQDPSLVLRRELFGREIRQQFRERGIEDDKLLRAMVEVPRHLFVPEEHRNAAYEDRSLPIGHGRPSTSPRWWP